MTNELETKIVSWLETSAQAIGDFASKEIPPFINEYLQWKFFECFYTPSILLLLAVVFLSIFLILRKFTDTDDGGIYEISYIFSAIFGIASGVSFIIASIVNSKEAIQIKLAPKVYLMEKAAEIIKNNSK